MAERAQRARRAVQPREPELGGPELAVLELAVLELAVREEEQGAALVVPAAAVLVDPNFCLFKQFERTRHLKHDK